MFTPTKFSCRRTALASRLAASRNYQQVPVLGAGIQSFSLKGKCLTTQARESLWETLGSSGMFYFSLSWKDDSPDKGTTGSVMQLWVLERRTHLPHCTGLSSMSLAGLLQAGLQLRQTLLHTTPCGWWRVNSLKNCLFLGSAPRQVLHPKWAFGSKPRRDRTDRSRNAYAATSYGQHGPRALTIEARSKPKYRARSKSNRSNRGVSCTHFSTGAPIRGVRSPPTPYAPYVGNPRSTMITAVRSWSLGEYAEA